MIADAIRTLLAARPDIRLASACRLYEQSEISLGKAAELAGMDIVSFKTKLHELGVDRMDLIFEAGPLWPAPQRNMNVALQAVTPSPCHLVISSSNNRRSSPAQNGSRSVPPDAGARPVG